MNEEDHRTKLTLGLWLRDHRIGSGRCVADLARAADVSEEAWASWETGSAPIPAAKVCGVAEALHIQLRTFLDLLDRFDRLRRLGEVRYAAGVTGLSASDEALAVLGSFEEFLRDEDEPGSVFFSCSGRRPLFPSHLPEKHPDKMSWSFTGIDYKMPTISRIRADRGDIARRYADAIVNAANTSLLGGGSVDGAIRRAAGPELTQACRALGGCAVGQARITEGYDLRARWVIHAVGPVWRGGADGEDELLASCYRSSLALAEQHGVRTIAFPAISAGTHRFPLDRAADIAVAEARRWLETRPLPQEIVFVCSSDEIHQSYERILGEPHAVPTEEPSAPEGT